MKLIILGAPGSGKGTQAKLLAKDLKLKHISTGDLFREEYKKETKLGIEAHKYWGKGNLVPEDITKDLILKNLPKNNYLLDGYPRTIYQAKFLDENFTPDFIIVLDVPFHTLKFRLLRRAKIEGRSDDTEEIIKERFKVYRKQTSPLLKYYKDKIILVDGDRKIEEIEKELIPILKK